MKKLTAEDRARIDRLREEGLAARENMQEILDRQEQRARKREERRGRHSLIRRLIPFGR